MKILVPIAIAESMLQSATSVAEPAAGETSWTSGGSYAVDDRRIRVATHRVYRCTSAHTGVTTPPESDPARWVDDGPTQRWAPFDTYVSTGASGTGSITYVLQPGFFNAVALYGLIGTSVQVTIKNSPGGSVVFQKTFSLIENSPGWYEYLFLPPRALSKLVLSGLPIRPAAEVTIMVSAAAAAPVAIGMIVLGDMRSLVGELAPYGGSQYGSAAEPVTYSYIDTDEFGATRIVRRHRATNMRAIVTLPRIYADQALAQIQEVLDVPVAWVASAANGYSGLNVFGLGSASVSYDSFNKASININVKGLI